MPSQSISKSQTNSGRRNSTQKKSAKPRSLTVLEQWVEVWTEDHITRTELYPGNDQLHELAAAMDSPPDLVYRRLNFRCGVPAEYLWTLPNKQALQYGGNGTQRMTFAQWLHVIDLEAQNGTGHIGPTGVGNLPRPNERGGCECPVCTLNQDMLAELGFQV